MKALAILNLIKNNDIKVSGILKDDIFKAIEELEAYITNYQGINRRLDNSVTALSVLGHQNKSLVKILEKYNKETIELKKVNQDFKNRSCENCKHNKGKIIL